MKKNQIWFTIILFCISSIYTVKAEEEIINNTSEKIENKAEKNVESSAENNSDDNSEIDIKSLNMHLSKAKFFIKRNKEDRALLELEKVLEADPKNKTALELKTQIIGELKTKNKDDVFDENSILGEETTNAEVDYMKIAEENWVILLILAGSFLAIVVILIFAKISKNKSSKNNSGFAENDSDGINNNNDKDPLSELDDVF